MNTTVGGVVRALKCYRDFYSPKTSSVMTPGTGRIDVDADPFRRGFLNALEDRTELLKRLAVLDERERAVVTLWYVADMPVREICERLAVSRSSCYRLRDRALERMAHPDAAALEIKEATA